MALKRLNKVKMTTAAPKAGDIPVVAIEGDLISQYIKADTQLKAAKALMEDLKPEITKTGLDEVFSLSCADPAHPVTTVKLQDEEGEVVRVEFTRTYGAIADVAAAENLFAGLLLPNGSPADINEYVQEVVVAKFDDKVFYDASGSFQQKVYDAFRKAIEDVAKKLDVPCPLETSKVVKPRETFHRDRFKAFPDTNVQANLTVLFPNTTRIVPVTVKVAK